MKQKGNPKIGARLKAARTANKLSAAAAANLVGINHQSTLYGYESDVGPRKADYGTLLRLCQLYGISPNELFEWPGFDRNLFKEVGSAVDEFLETRRKQPATSGRLDLYFAIYDALGNDPDTFRDTQGRLDISAFWGLIRLSLTD